MQSGHSCRQEGTLMRKGELRQKMKPVSMLKTFLFRFIFTYTPQKSRKKSILTPENSYENMVLRPPGGPLNN